MPILRSPLTGRSLAADAAFGTAFADARRVHQGTVRVRPHRSLTPLHVTPWLLAQALLLPVFFCGLLWWSQPLLMDLWRECILFWSDALHLPYALTTVLDPTAAGGERLQSTGQDIPMPTDALMLGTLVAVVAAAAGTTLLRGAALPLRYPVRIMCAVQAVALAYFWFAPERFPYGIARHSDELMRIGYLLMMATPVMLSIGYYILNESVVTKVLRTAGMLIFLAVMVPHQVLSQALVLQHATSLFMPLLYICFGAVFDALVFVALYSWMAGDTSRRATL